MGQQTVTHVEATKKKGTNKRGPWFFYLFEDAGGNKWQTGFSDGVGTKLADALEASGDRLNVVLKYHEEQNGDFTNNVIDSFEELGHGEDVAQITHAAPSANSSKDESIARAVAFKGAIDLASNGVLDPDPDGIVSVAQFFETYLLTGRVAEVAERL